MESSRSVLDCLCVSALCFISFYASPDLDACVLNCIRELKRIMRRKIFLIKIISSFPGMEM